MKHKIFFSWQSDTQTKSGRNLVERALDRAIGAIGLDTEVEEAIREGLELDKDTKGISGSPPIVETIFKKIDAAAVFVADLTFAGRRPDGAPIPNPNVLIEYGWALKALGHGRIVAVMNTAFGNPSDEQMPFDMRHLRHPIQYHCTVDADDETRARARNSLAKQLEGAIRAVIESDEFKASLPQPPKPPPFPAREPLDGRGRFRSKGQPIGVSHDRGSETHDVHLTEGSAIWLRVMPQIDSGKRWSSVELQEAATQTNGLLMPINSGQGGYGYIRAQDGFGVRFMMGNDAEPTPCVVFIFKTGEVWTIDSYLVTVTRQQTPSAIPLDEKSFAKSLGAYSRFLSRLEVEPPYRWIAGMEGVKGRGLFVPAPPGRVSFSSPRGSCLVDHIEVEGLHSPSDSARKSLRPFFDAIFDNCGLERPAWLDQ